MRPSQRSTVAIETHGCKLNQADSQVLARRFEQQGYVVVPPDQGADVYILNTCTVTKTADRKARQAIRAAQRRNPHALIVATGCYAQRAPAEVARVQGISLVLGNLDKDRLVEQVMDLQGQPPVACAVGDEVPWHPAPRRTRAMVKIQEGCNQVCAYCIVPRVRGRERSIPPQALLADIRALTAAGYREVVLTGTQLGSYGFDLAGTSLSALLAAVLRETPVERLRVSSLQPQEIDEQLLANWEDARLCPHFHIPLQSGSDAVLPRMRRRYSTAQYAQAVERIRQRLPHASITTDVIVGFPGEGEAEFQATLELCAAIGFAAIHAFPYSVRPGTSAAHSSDQVDAPTKVHRMERLLALAKIQQMAFQQSQIGTLHRILWEDCQQVDGVPTWSGLTEHYLRVRCSSEADLASTITPARLDRCENGVLWATPLG